MLPFSEAAERNKKPILDVISDVLKESREALEVGAGTGQHALYFASNMQHLNWRATDRMEYLEGLQNQFSARSIENLIGPTELDVNKLPWPSGTVDLVYTANTFHIMSWQSVESFFEGLDQCLEPAGHLIVYGPFKYRRQFTSPSNSSFDLSLKSRDPRMGIRDFEAVNGLATDIGLKLLGDHSMPANNQCLIWQR